MLKLVSGVCDLCQVVNGLFAGKLEGSFYKTDIIGQGRLRT